MHSTCIFQSRDAWQAAKLTDRQQRGVQSFMVTHGWPF